MLATIVGDRTGTCVECGTEFTYRARGIPQVTCSTGCRARREGRLALEARARFGLAHSDVGALGYPARLTCRSVSREALQTRVCAELASVLYVEDGGATYALCPFHDDSDARELAGDRQLLRVPLGDR